MLGETTADSRMEMDTKRSHLGSEDHLDSWYRMQTNSPIPKLGVRRELNTVICVSLAPLTPLEIKELRAYRAYKLAFE